MIKKLQKAIRWLLFYYKAANGKGHGTHSPFVYQFITEVLNDTRYYYAFEEIETYSEQLPEGFKLPGNFSTEYNQLLFRMVCYYQPKSILEIGLASGVTTAYLASANSKNQVTSICQQDGNQLAAKQILKDLAIDNVSIVPFSDFMKQVKKGDGLKYGFIVINDISLMESFGGFDLFNFVHKDTIVAFGGINDSKKNNNLWKKTINNDATTLAVTLFGIGLMFFKKEQLIKQQFAIRF